MTREEAIAYLEDPFPLSNSLSIERRLELHAKALRMAIEALKAQSAQPEPIRCMDRLIGEKAAIDAIQKHFNPNGDEMDPGLASILAGVAVVLHSLPSAQPEITDGQAVEHLQASGWMQNHDKQMYEMGLREKLADDSDSYDALLPSAHPEPQYDEWCTDCKEYDHERHCCPRFNRVIHETLDDTQAERNTGKWIIDGHHIRCDQCGMAMCDTDREGDRIPRGFCPNCGAYMKGEEEE